MCTAEAYFLRAEGALNGWNMGGTAKDLYECRYKSLYASVGNNDEAAITAYKTAPLRLFHLRII